MLYDIARDPHETTDLHDSDTATTSTGASLLDEWTSTQLAGTGVDDPMDTVRQEGGPFHIRQHLAPHIDGLRATGRAHWADLLERRHPNEL